MDTSCQHKHTWETGFEFLKRCLKNFKQFLRHMGINSENLNIVYSFKKKNQPTVVGVQSSQEFWIDSFETFGFNSLKPSAKKPHSCGTRLMIPSEEYYGLESGMLLFPNRILANLGTSFQKIKQNQNTRLSNLSRLLFSCFKFHYVEPVVCFS